jgi:hypothetical protein
MLDCRQGYAIGILKTGAKRRLLNNVKAGRKVRITPDEITPTKDNPMVSTRRTNRQTRRQPAVEADTLE